jgi:non-ribosomal peptide synthetase component F
MQYVSDLVDTPVTVAMSGPIQSPAQGDLAFVIYSGEDVRPGGVAIEHRSVINWLLGHQEHFRISPGVRVAESSAARLEAPWLSLLPVLSGGISVMVDDGPGVPDTTLRLGSAGVEVARVDSVSLRGLLQAPDDQLEACRSLRTVACDGRELTPDLVASFYGRMSSSGIDARLHAVYGWPESTGHGATMAFPVLEVTPSTTLAGRAAPNARLYVVDDWGGLCPIGVPGEMWIGGAPLARGYLNRANLTAERFFPDPFARGGRVFRTGERARWRTDGGLEQLGPLRL